MEEWRDIEGYEGVYQVSNEGRVKSLERDVVKEWKGKPYISHLKEKILELEEYDKYGHLRITPCKNGILEYKTIHQLVAKAFIPNPNGYTDVHHKDHNPSNNRVENLQWISKEDHYKEHSDRKAVREACGIKVDQIDKITGETIKTWESSRQVEDELGFCHSAINRCCNGGFYRKGKWINTKIYKGYVWKHHT